GVGFEPTIPLGITVFKTAAFNHSAIPPIINCIEYKCFAGSPGIYLGHIFVFGAVTGFCLP
ncbi:MAG: hypothetical protein JXA35_02930, partial [Deltaproteobacteria bacterium]|nr:hypothetical protein [Deltaproteobacteria bacterium]